MFIRVYSFDQSTVCSLNNDLCCCFGDAENDVIRVAARVECEGPPHRIFSFVRFAIVDTMGSPDFLPACYRC